MFRFIQLLLPVIILLTVVPVLNADAVPSGGGLVPDLYTTLKDGLRAKTEIEMAYCRTVADLVNKQKLSYKLVKSTFGWAKKRPRKVRFQYFQFALEKRLGYKIAVKL